MNIAREKATPGDERTFQILSAIEREETVTQRGLSRELGIALGLTNSLVKRLTKQGWIRVSHVSLRRFRYYLTPAGLAEKSRLARLSLLNTLRLYTNTRNQIRSTLTKVIDGEAKTPRLVLYGAGDVAEITFVVVSHTGLDLVGVVDDSKVGSSFFGFTIESPETLRQKSSYDKVVVTSLRRAGEITRRLEELNIEASRVVYL